MSAYQPKTGQPCSCRPGIERDNCPQCEGTGQRIDFAAIRAQHSIKWRIIAEDERDSETDQPLYWSNALGWCERNSADVFTEREAANLRLPVGGNWTAQ